MILLDSEIEMRRGSAQYRFVEEALRDLGWTAFGLGMAAYWTGFWPL